MLPPMVHKPSHRLLLVKIINMLIESRCRKIKANKIRCIHSILGHLLLEVPVAPEIVWEWWKIREIISDSNKKESMKEFYKKIQNIMEVERMLFRLPIQLILSENKKNLQVWPLVQMRQCVLLKKVEKWPNILLLKKKCLPKQNLSYLNNEKMIWT